MGKSGSAYAGLMTGLQKIRDKRADLARQRAALERQDAELAIAEKVMAEIEGDETPAQPALPAGSAPTALSKLVATSRRTRILEALSGEKVFMTSAEINEAIAKRYGAPIKGSSLYPMLSLLKQEKVIVRAGKNGELIAIKRRAEGGSEVTT